MRATSTIRWVADAGSADVSESHISDVYAQASMIICYQYFGWSHPAKRGSPNSRLPRCRGYPPAGPMRARLAIADQKVRIWLARNPCQRAVFRRIRARRTSMYW